MNSITPNPSESQDRAALEHAYNKSNLAIVNMIEELLAQDNFIVVENDNGEYELHEHTDTGSILIDTYDNRAAAYRGGIDCLIEACVFGSDES
jgi:hypothetical protein